MQIPGQDTTTFTPDDERNLALYLAVLKAKADGVSDADIARDLFGIDASAEPERARETVTAWHRRALQLTESDTLKKIASPK